MLVRYLRRRIRLQHRRTAVSAAETGPCCLRSVREGVVRWIAAMRTRSRALVFGALPRQAMSTTRDPQLHAGPRARRRPGPRASCAPPDWVGCAADEFGALE